MIEITFPNQSSAEAGMLAQELRAGLLRAGVPPATLSIGRDNPEAMDAGTILHIAVITLEAIALAKVLYELCVPARTGLRIKGPNGTFDIAPAEVDVEFLQKLLAGIQEPQT